MEGGCDCTLCGIEIASKIKSVRLGKHNFLFTLTDLAHYLSTYSPERRTMLVGYQYAILALLLGSLMLAEDQPHPALQGLALDPLALSLA